MMCHHHALSRSQAISPLVCFSLCKQNTCHVPTYMRAQVRGHRRCLSAVRKCQQAGDANATATSQGDRILLALYRACILVDVSS